MTTDQAAPKTDIHKAAFIAFMDEFVAETDRAAVVLGAAKVDSMLRNLLDRFLLPHPGSEDDLLEGDAPLATFSARIRLCQRLGLIDTQFAKLLHVFRKLRNDFAHDVAHSSLKQGTARDRVLALAQPFANSDFFQGLLAKVASSTGRDATDAGAIFRTVLALFYIELHRIVDATQALKQSGRDPIVDSVRKRTLPKE